MVLNINCNLIQFLSFLTYNLVCTIKKGNIFFWAGDVQQKVGNMICWAFDRLAQVHGPCKPVTRSLYW